MAASLQARMRLTPVRRILIAAFVMDFAVAVVSLAVQFRGSQLGASPLVLGLLGTAGSLAYTLGCLFTGRLSDRAGRRVLTGVSCLLAAVVWLAMPRAATPLQLLAIIPVGGFAISMFWPPLQAWLWEVTVGGRRRLAVNLGSFNVLWTAGLMVGPPAAGFAWALGYAAPFVIAVIAVIATLLLLMTVPAHVEGGGEEAAADAAHKRPDGDAARRYLYLAWIANFASWFGRGMNAVVFPKLGLDLHWSEASIGLVLACLLAGQLVSFIWLRTRSGWQYRTWPLLASLGVGAIGYVLSYLAASPVAFAVSFALSGFAAGVTYVASLYYSLDGGSDDRGGRTGLHEAVLGSGLFIGPLMGGIVGEAVSLRAPYLATVVVFAVCAVAVYLVSHHLKRRESFAEAAPSVASRAQ